MAKTTAKTSFVAAAKKKRTAAKKKQLIPERPFSPDWRDMAYVPRWAIARRNRHQYLAEHSYFVAVYADQIARLIGWQGDYADLMRHALYHDIDETVTGDIPGPAKRKAWNKNASDYQINPVLADKFGQDVTNIKSASNAEIKAIVSAADSVEELAYISEELISGNVWIASILDETKSRMLKRWFMLPASIPLLKDLWEKHFNSFVLGQHEKPKLLKDTP